MKHFKKNKKIIKPQEVREIQITSKNGRLTNAVQKGETISIFCIKDKQNKIWIKMCDLTAILGYGFTSTSQRYFSEYVKGLHYIQTTDFLNLGGFNKKISHIKHLVLMGLDELELMANRVGGETVQKFNKMKEEILTVFSPEANAKKSNKEEKSLMVTSIALVKVKNVYKAQMEEILVARDNGTTYIEVEGLLKLCKERNLLSIFERNMIKTVETINLDGNKVVPIENINFLKTEVIALTDVLNAVKANQDWRIITGKNKIYPYIWELIKCIDESWGRGSLKDEFVKQVYYFEPQLERFSCGKIVVIKDYTNQYYIKTTDVRDYLGVPTVPADLTFNEKQRYPASWYSDAKHTVNFITYEACKKWLGSYKNLKNTELFLNEYCNFLQEVEGTREDENKKDIMQEEIKMKETKKDEKIKEITENLKIRKLQKHLHVLKLAWNMEQLNTEEEFYALITSFLEIANRTVKFLRDIERYLEDNAIAEFGESDIVEDHPALESLSDGAKELTRLTQELKKEESNTIKNINEVQDLIVSWETQLELIRKKQIKHVSTKQYLEEGIVKLTQ